jgi:alkaline phosphatase D
MRSLSMKAVRGVVAGGALLFGFAGIAGAQHDPGRNGVRLLMKGQAEKVEKELGRNVRGVNSPLDEAEKAYVRMLGACLKKDADQALAQARKAVAAGMPFARLQAGPRDALAPLYAHRDFRKWQEAEGKALLHGPMLGCVTDRSARFWVRTAAPVTVSVELSKSEGGGAPIRSKSVKTMAARDCTAVIEQGGLSPDTEYRYRVVLGDRPSTTSAVFRTSPPRDQPATFSIGFGGGAGYTPKNEHMWSLIAGMHLRAFLTLGDNVYIDDPKHAVTQRYCYYRRQSQSHWRTFVAGTPIYAIYDDHDFGENDCIPGPEIGTPTWKRSVWNVFRENWNNPAYGGGEKQPGCWFDFSIGDVHFILLDGRYYREKGRSMLGSVQKRWLLETLKKSKGRFKVLASPVPWSAGVKPGSRDTWDGFSKEREQIFTFLDENRISGVILMAADRHRSDLRRTRRPNGYDLYEVMSSRLTNVHTHSLTEGAKGSEFIFGYNKTCSLGVLDFDTKAANPTVTYRIVTIDGKETHRRTLTLAELSHGAKRSAGE